MTTEEKINKLVKEYKAEYNRRYRQANKERIYNLIKKWRKDNPDKYKSISIKYIRKIRNKKEN